MGYGLGAAVEGAGAFASGIREQRDRESALEERRINKLYTRYQLASGRRQDAEGAYAELARDHDPAGTPHEAELESARKEEREMRQELYDTLSGKSKKGEQHKGAKGLWHRFLQMDEARLPPDQGGLPPVQSQKTGRRPMDEKLPDGRTVQEAIGQSAGSIGKRPTQDTRPPLPTPRIGSLNQPMPSAPATAQPLSMASQPPQTTSYASAEMTPEQLSGFRSRTMEAMATTAPEKPVVEPGQELDEPQGEFAPEGRVQAGLPYKWSQAPEQQPRGYGQIRQESAQRAKYASGKTLDEITVRKAKDEVSKIFQNLGEYVDHVKRTKSTEDDSFEHAQMDPDFNRHLTTLRDLAAASRNEAIVTRQEIDSFLDDRFADSPSRIRSRAPQTEEQKSRDEWWAAKRKEGLSYSDTLALEAKAKNALASSKSRMSELQAKAIDDQLKAINPKTGKLYTNMEVWQMIPRGSAVGGEAAGGPAGPTIEYTDPDTGETTRGRLGKAGTDVQQLTVEGTPLRSKVPPIPREKLLMPFSYKQYQLHQGPTNVPAEILSAQKVVNAYVGRSDFNEWMDYYQDHPELFEDTLSYEDKKEAAKIGKTLEPTQYDLLLTLIRAHRDTRRSRAEQEKRRAAAATP
jgi:hypothetical protein